MAFPIELLLNQSVEVRRRGATGGYGEYAYSDPETLPARVELKQSQIMTPSGTETLSTTRVVTAEEIGVGDLVDGREVQARENVVDFDGSVVGWVSYL